MKKNLRIYIYAFVFALILWLYLSLNITYNVILSIPIDIQLSKSQALSEDLPEEIEVNVSGKGWDLLNLILSRDVDYSVDLTSIKKDTKIITSRAISERLSLPLNVSILSIKPDTLNISFDKVSRKYVKVMNNVEVIPAGDYRIVGDPKITPDSVLISGASSILSRIKFLSTEYKLIKDIKKNIVETVSLKDTLRNVIKVEPRNVSISYTVELSAEKILDNLNIEVANLPEDKEVLLIPPQLKLSLRGGVDELSSLIPSDIRVIVEYSSIENDTLGFIVPEIVLPVSAEIINVEPKKFQYIIKKK